MAVFRTVRRKEDAGTLRSRKLMRKIRKSSLLAHGFGMLGSCKAGTVQSIMRKYVMIVINAMIKGLAVVVLSYLLVGCATNIAGRSQFLLVSPESAVASSQLAYTNTLTPLQNEGKLDKDPALLKRVKRITDRLVEQAVKLRPNTAQWQWEVHVIDDPETVNAWCMAGGRMAIYTGLINKLKATDDEIAQVMGHEISHALADHVAEKMSIAMAQGLALEALKASGKVGDSTMTVTSMAAQVALTLPNSRTAESEADILGIEIAAKAGYNPEAAVSLWEKMARVGGGGGPEFLSTHPAPETRQQGLRHLVPKMMPYYLAAKKK